LDRELESTYGFKFDLKHWLEQQHEADADDWRDHVIEEVERFFREKEAMYGSEIMRAAEKFFLLQVLDQHWKEHLAAMDYLRQGIYLRGYAQKQPKQEFKREAFELFELMLERVKHEIIQMLARVRIRSEDEVQALEQQQQRQAQARQLQFQHAEAGGLPAGEPEPQPEPRVTIAQQTPVQRDAPKVGRNDPCPCGSGKKYKHCHGQIS
jgi:preprotein translocase subunit SecA